MANEFSDKRVGSAVQECPLQKQPAAPTHWIELELLGDDDSPIPHAAYEVRMPDGSVAKGFLDDTGFIRIQKIAGEGACLVLFPELDAEAWSTIDVVDARG
ncbi:MULTISPECIES: hypothetical protein [unclassified Duganella]|uniref:hypothetical protein n=1 Tax=unclassified Duganella TaxID=2636909 RepID=UPI000E34D865|nr:MULTISPECIES: hypothetical protein [unclassified Duganella]RFP19563.1 hypothetical protein D0T23_07290 [Duganella sp. BJB475]RFP36144.1 hypothetical protein D0T21_06835 [Duganella sp. BJB476]